MAEHHSESLYMKIFYYLLALTILEILVALLRCDADIATGRQAPIMRLDRGAIGHFHQPLDIAQLGVRKPLLKPVSLPHEVTREPQRLDCLGTRRLQRLARLGHVAIVPDFRISRVDVLHCDVDRAAGELRREIDLLDQIAATVRQRM